MEKKNVISQMTSWNTYMHVLRRMELLAENVFLYKNLPRIIDKSYFNQTLFKQGSIAFFYDDVLDSVLALPYTSVGKQDIYGRPMEIMVRAYNGRYYRRLKYGEFVIMWDNTGRYSMLLDICQMAQRVARNKKTIDVNLSQQRTPRIFKTSQDKVRTVKDLSNNIDAFEESVVAYDSIDIDEMQSVLAPAPFVADKVIGVNDKEWAEFYSFIGISNLQEIKKERVIRDEMQISQGGTIASRHIRYQSRLDAIEEINEKFKDKLKEPISVEFYDGLPANIEIESEEDEDVLSNVSDTVLSTTSD